MSADFLQDLAIILAVAGVVTLVFHRLKQPVVLGYILAGLIVGPHTPPFPLVHDRHTIEILAELGVILLMFGLGLHFSLRKLAQVGPTAFIAATMEILLMLLLGYGIGQTFGWGKMDSLFLGAILSISSTTIILKALQELGLVKQSFAQVVFGILIIEDILAIAMIALLSSLATTGGLPFGHILLTLGRLVVFLTVVLVLGLLLVPKLLRYVTRFKSQEMLLVTVLGLCFGVSLLALKLGYSVALGAFLIGAIVAETREHGRIDTLVEPIRDMFSAVFFVAIGMLIEPRMLLDHAGPISVITLAVVLGKVAACALGAFVAGHDLRTSLRVGMSLAQIGEFSFIIASLGLSLKVTSEFLYPIAVTVSALTTLLTPYLIRVSDPLVTGFDRAAPRWLTTYLSLYSQWINSLRNPHESSQLRRLVRRALLQMGLNIILVTGLFIAASWIGRSGRIDRATVPTWAGGGKTALWLITALLALPLLIATLRKLRALSMLLAEMRVSRAMAKEHTAAIRAILANGMLMTGMALLLLWILLLSSAILPPWPILLGLLVVVGAVAAIMWQRFVRIYAQAQVSLRDTFSHPAEPPLVEPLPAPLQGARLETLPLPAHSSADGKLIRELQVRTRSGASIVGISRQGVSIINPGPDEELYSGDEILLLGTSDQLAAAATLLASPAPAQPK